MSEVTFPRSHKLISFSYVPSADVSMIPVSLDHQMLGFFQETNAAALKIPLQKC